MKVKEKRNMPRESNGIKKRYPPPTEAATPTDMKPKEFQEILAALDPRIFGPYTLFFETNIILSALADTNFRD